MIFPRLVSIPGLPSSSRTDNLLQFKNYGLALLNWFYPKRCISCARDLAFDSSRYLCAGCWEGIRPLPEPLCIRCGDHLPDGGMHCFFCKHEKIYFTMVRSFSKFDGALRESIHQFKYKGRDYLCAELSLLLVPIWNRYTEIQKSDIVVPVPLHSSSLRERGYNQSGLLAREFVSQTGTTGSIQLIENALVRVKKTKSQTVLSKSERFSNMESAFQAAKPEALKDKAVLLIDDVCTTGATLNECAKTLKKAGAKEVYGLTLARD